MTYTEVPTIEIEGLTKRFGGERVLDALDLRLVPGVTALLGRNGAGKTTLVRILATLLAPDSGRARVCGYDVITNAAAVRRRIGVTGQFAAVDGVLTGRENLELVGRLWGLGHRARARADELLERFALDPAADRRAANYSGGMRRRLDLAMTLLTTPAVVFLDEPTTGLDASSRLALWEDIRRLAGGGTIVLLTTQDLDEADALAGRVVVLHGGRVVADDAPGRLKARAWAPTTSTSSMSGGCRSARSRPGRRRPSSLPPWPRCRPDAIVGIRHPTLDEVFLELTAANDHRVAT